MVIHIPSRHARQNGALLTEIMVAVGLLVGALLPLAYSIATEQRMARFHYMRAVAMEIVDGEMEVLAAGEWRSFTPGSHEYSVRAHAATNLPPGRFQLTLENNNIRLEWRPAGKRQGTPVMREVKVK